MTVRKEKQEERREFLSSSVKLAGAATVGALSVPMLDGLNPSAATEAASSVEIDVSKIPPAGQVTVPWQGKAVMVMNRTPEMLATLEKVQAQGILKDPDLKVPNQPPYAKNIYRARMEHKNLLVLVRICTHMCCIPLYKPKPNSVRPGWLGGFHCPCHGSMYDLSARVIVTSPAPRNMAIPEYHYENGGKKVVVTKMYPKAKLC